MQTIEAELRHRLITDKDIPQDQAARLSRLDPVMIHLCAILDERVARIAKCKHQPDEE